MTTLRTAVPGVTITETGLLVPEIADVLAGRLTDLDLALGGGMNKSLTSPQGQIASSDAEIIAEMQDKLLCLFNQMNPDFSTGRFQDGIGRIYFMDRIPGRGTLVTAQCSGAVGAVIPSGSMAVDKQGYQYLSVNEEVIGPSGVVDVVFQNLVNGPIACGSNELTQIYRAVPGWDSVTNAAPGVQGNDVESRAAFETRRQQSVSRNAKNTDAAVMAAVLDVPGVVDAWVWSNRDSVVVVKGETAYPVKPKSIFISVYGGANDAVAQAILSRAFPGVDFNGDISVTVEQRDGYESPYPTYVVGWLRAVLTRVYFTVNVQNSDTLPSDAETEIRKAVQATFNGEDGRNPRARIGSLIGVGRYYPSVTALGDINVTSISVSLDGLTWQTGVTMGIDQMPTLQDSDIAVVIA
ncbi:baseplate J/gp47 family protein [Trabulsiella odontotermitis]|uniref:Baseplate protein J-like barrel domain-containing protein n=1 Tax=Trabulsiella odontotermitis TaxID=379893 RepID=A0A0L0GZ56_9ENTR|nr:baseplate J/gp47 family protein [Trabulsiella odontotermitis]KNC94039.1 hypothetical protein GM31_16920 [Trabulsiella odontotermitis]